MDKCALLWNILAVFLSKGLGREASDSFERTAQVALIGKAELPCNLRQGLSIEQQVPGLLNAPGKNVLMRRKTRGLFKSARKVIRAQANQRRQSRQRQRLGEMIMNIVGDLPHIDG